MQRELYQFKPEDAERFAQSIGAITFRKGKNLHFKTCPYCNGTGRTNEESFAIDMETGQFHCLRAGCGAKGNMLTLAKDFDFSLGTMADAYYRPKPHQYRTLKTPKETIVPKPRAIEYMASRGISGDICKRYQITSQTDKPDVIVFPFFDDRGQLVSVKYRNSNFRKGIDNAKEWFEKGTKPILFGMLQCNPENGTLVMAEGECDALALATAGVENPISVPNGAKGFTWVPHCWDWLNRYTTLIVFGDFEDGKITLLEEIKNHVRLKIMHVREEDYKDCKDANDILRKYGPEYLKQCVERAIDIPINGIKDLADVEFSDVFKIEKVPTGLRDIDRFMYGGIPFGGVTLLTGKPGSGKSSLASQIIISAAEHGYKCFCYSGELTNSIFAAWMSYQVAGPQHIQERTNNWGDPEYTLSVANSNTIREWFRGKILVYDSDALDLDSDLAELVETAIIRDQCRVILIDNLMTGLDLVGTHGSDKFDRQSQFMKRFVRIALHYNVCILMVVHKRKNNLDDDENDEVMGSSDIVNLATVTMSYVKDKGIAPDERKLKISKNRLFGKVNTMGWTMRFQAKSKRIASETDNFTWECSCFRDDYNFDDAEETPFEDIDLE